MPDAQKTRKTLVMRILEEENMIKITRSAYGSSGSDSAFYTNTNPTSSGPGRRSGQDPDYIKEIKARTRCHQCNKLGHWKRECPDLPKEMEFVKRESSAHLTESKRERVALTAIVEEPTQSLDSEKIAPAEISESCIGISKALLAVHSTQTWYADGGASEHMSDCKEYFTDMREVPTGKWSVLIANDQRFWVEGIGKVQIERWVDGQWCSGCLEGVLYVPKLRANLFSIGAAADRGVVTIYKRDGCSLIDDDGKGKEVVTGYRSGKLYKLNIRAIGNQVDPEATSTALKTESLQTWHNRFCHLNNDYVKTTATIVTGVNLPSTQGEDYFCEGCVYGKQHRSTFKTVPGKLRSTKSGTFIHMDLCGPLATISFGGASYFMLVKDDESGYMFIYFLAHKSEALTKFQSVEKEILLDMKVQVNCIRTDHGGEFSSKDFQQYTTGRGIKHELSAQYAPEQNGYIERSNRTVVEAVRSLLHAKNLLLGLWAEAAATVVHVLNRSVNKRLNSLTPYELLYKVRPLFSYIWIWCLYTYPRTTSL